MKPCARCTTPAKCGVHGCCPGAWPAETSAAKTAAQRQAERKVREEAAGNKLYKRWVPPEDFAPLDELVAKLAAKRAKASRKPKAG